MSGSLNRVSLIGNLGKDPEIRTLNNGSRCASFSLACSESWTDKSSGEKREKTEWINVVVFNDGLVGVIDKYVKKGSKIYVEGKFATRKWEKDGIERYTTEVVIQNFGGQILLLGDPKGDAGGGGAGGGYDQGRGGGSAGGGQTKKPDGVAVEDDEIPFVFNGLSW